jgi:hypothetical protein
MFVTAFEIRRCTAPGCGRAVRDVRLRSLHERMIIRLTTFEEETGLSVAALKQCTHCSKWLLQLRYSRMPLPVTAELFPAAEARRA